MSDIDRLLDVMSNQAWPGFMRADTLCRYLDDITKPTLYKIVNTDPEFPRQVRHSDRCVGWRKESIDEWLRAKEGAA